MFVAEFEIPEELSALRREYPRFLEAMDMALDFEGESFEIMMGHYTREAHFARLFEEMAFFGYARAEIAFCYFLHEQQSLALAPVVILNSEGGFRILGMNLADALVCFADAHVGLEPDDKEQVIREIRAWIRKHGIEQTASPKEIARTIKKIKMSPNYRLYEIEKSLES